VGENALSAELRTGTGKGVARKLRAAGRVPAVVYGRGQESRSLALDPRAFERLIQKSEAGLNTLIDLEVGGQTQVVLVKELQREPLGGAIVHADFYAVDLTRTLEVDVPIHLTGIPIGVSLSGGILDHTLRELRVECLPTAIPDSVEVDVSALEIGDSIHVRDLALPEGVILKADPDLSVAAVAAPAAEEVPAVAAEAAAPVVEGEAAAAAEGAPAAEASEE
jgi:large subunit ribosomal protein L25